MAVPGVLLVWNLAQPSSSERLTLNDGIVIMIGPTRELANRLANG
jgi:hypothetical protein